MSDEKDISAGLGVTTEGDRVEADHGGPDSLQPMHMQLFSTWEVKKVPVNCVPRLCTLQVTRLEVSRPLEAGLGSIVLAASMKTPHRFLRSNEIKVPPSGLLTIPLELTFSLQYPHFLKRGGNILQIRLQRRKRVRNRPLGGYKNLAIGLVEMSQVLQRSFQGEVKLYSEKVTEHMAVVTVGSITSTTVDLERRQHMVEASSEEDDEDIFSDDHIGSDTESGDNEQQTYESKKKFKPSTAAVLRLLRLNQPSKPGRHHHPNRLMIEEEEGFHGSSIAFASSPSDSEEEEEEGVVDTTPARPTLSPFFGSDRCSMVSLPTSAKSAEKMESFTSHLDPGSAYLKRYDSLEQAIHKERKNSPILTSFPYDDRTWDLTRGRVWCVAEDLPASDVVVKGLERNQEVVTRTQEEVDAVHTVLSLINSVFKQWKDTVPFSVVLVGNDSLISNSVQALTQSRCSPEKLRFSLIPIVPGLMSTRLSSLDDKYQLAFPPDREWVAGLQDSIDVLMQYVEDASNSLPLPLAKVVLQKSTGDPGFSSERSLAFMCNVSIGSWDVESDTPPSTISLPTSPPGSGGGGSMETPELNIEYWSPKRSKEKLHQGSVKVRSVIVSYVDNILNVTATKEKKGKGRRIRKSKDSDAGGSIVSLTATQLICRPVVKGESVVVTVDGVEREEVNLVRLQASWDLTPNGSFSMAVTSGVGDR